MQIFVCFLKKNKIEAKMPRFETRHTELGPRAQHWSHAPEHTLFFIFQDTRGLVSPSLPVVRNKLTRYGGDLGA